MLPHSFALGCALVTQLLPGAAWAVGDAQAQHEPPPLAVKLDRALGAGRLEQLRRIRERVLSSDLEDVLTQRRNFGLGEDTGGHETTFLHRHLDDEAPELRARLLEITSRADIAAGWNVTSGVNLTARCLEYIRYESGEAQQEDIGWHGDGSSLLVLAIMISPQGDFAGGKLEFRDSNRTQYAEELEAGDALAWRGWTHHRVTPVTAGRRDVFVVEWWMGEDSSVSLEPRGGNRVEDILHALSLDPGSAILHRWLAEAYCVQLPCKDDATAELAEEEYRRAIDIEPKDAMMVQALGNFLIGSPRLRQQVEGVRKLKEAHNMDPKAVGVPTLPRKAEIWENVFSQIPQFVACLAVLCILGPAAYYLDKRAVTPIFQFEIEEEERKRKAAEEAAKGGAAGGSKDSKKQKKATEKKKD